MSLPTQYANLRMTDIGCQNKMQKQNSDFPNTLVITYLLLLELLTHKEGINSAESVPAEGLWKSFIFHCLEEREMLLYWKFTHFPGSVLSSSAYPERRESDLPCEELHISL